MRTNLAILVMITLFCGGQLIWNHTQHRINTNQLTINNNMLQCVQNLLTANNALAARIARLESEPAGSHRPQPHPHARTASRQIPLR